MQSCVAYMAVHCWYGSALRRTGLICMRQFIDLLPVITQDVAAVTEQCCVSVHLLAAQVICPACLRHVEQPSAVLKQATHLALLSGLSRLGNAR